MVCHILMDKYSSIIKSQLAECYYDPRELKYGTYAKTFLSAYEFEELLKRKADILQTGNDPRLIKLDLHSWNSNPFSIRFRRN